MESAQSAYYDHDNHNRLQGQCLLITLGKLQDGFTGVRYTGTVTVSTWYGALAAAAECWW
jgi:hypothetical protein